MHDQKGVYENAEEVANWTYSGLTLYYKDCDLSPAVSGKFSVNQILCNGYFLDCSATGGGMHFNTRFLIASSKAVDLYKINPDNEKYAHCCINANSFFKVLDITEINGKKQIFVLHIPAGGIAYFRQTISNLDEQIIEKAQTGFSEKLAMQPIPALLEDFWVKRTNFPLGMDGYNNFYSINELNPIPENARQLYSGLRNMLQEQGPLNDPNVHFPEKQPENKGFFSRLFGKN